MREVGRTPLLVEGGKRLYVEPYAVTPNARGDAFLAGRFNYLLERDPAGQWQRAPETHLFGALVPRTGEPRIIRSPVPTALLGSIRAVAQDDGTWAVVFAEVVPTAEGDFRSSTVARLWSGTHDGQRWVRLDTIPRPAQAALHPDHTSALLSRGDTLFWAVRARSGHAFNVAVFTGHAGRWTSEVVPTSTAAEFQLAHGDSTGLLLAVVQADPSLREDSNSLMLWAQRPTWHLVRRLVHGRGEGRVNTPQFTRPGGELALTWVSWPLSEERVGLEVRAMDRILGGEERPRVVIDSSAYKAAALVVGGAAWWVVDHVSPTSEAGEIRFIHDRAGSPTVAGRLPNPYITPFGAGALSATTLLLSGALQDSTPGSGVVTLLLRFETRCR